MTFVTKWVEVVPETEWNQKFIQGMADRMMTSHFKYGAIKESSERINWVADLKKRIERYEETGNTEWLMDAANYCMIEFTHPQHPNAHFMATGSEESPGRKWFGENKRSSRHIKEF